MDLVPKELFKRVLLAFALGEQWTAGGAVNEGIDAYIAGAARSACPYEPAEQEYYDWLAGWNQAAAFLEENNS